MARRIVHISSNQTKLNINSNEEIDMIQRRIIGCYLNGYDKIVVKSPKNFTREQQDSIRTIVRSLYMRIFESHANQVTLQAFMDESLASVTSGVERMHIITFSMAKDVLNAMKNWDKELARSVISLEEDVDQFLFFLTRLLRIAVYNPSLARKLEVTMGDCFDYHLLVNRIEYVADCLGDIADALIKLQEHRDMVSEEFMDKAPPEVYAALLDRGQYLCSIRTMYRILEVNQEVRERRDQLRHPFYAKPELLATAPNQVLSKV